MATSVLTLEAEQVAVGAVAAVPPEFDMLSRLPAPVLPSPTRRGWLNPIRARNTNGAAKRGMANQIHPRASKFRSAAQNVQRLRDELLFAQTELHRELEVVGEFQRSLLPEVLPEIPGFDISSYYQPSKMAGGDYFDVVPLAGGMWGLVVADVAGHGASAAVIMAVLRALVHAHLPQTRYMPSRVFLEFLNRQLTGTYTRDGRFVTVWCAVLDPVARTLTYASAGHNPPRLVRGGTVTALNAVGGLPLGIEEPSVYQEVTVTLHPGDLLVTYTDGITEASRFDGGVRELFETERLDRVLLESRGDSAQDCVKRVTKAVNAFTGLNVPADDQTMLVIRVQDPITRSGSEKHVTKLSDAGPMGVLSRLQQVHRR